MFFIYSKLSFGLKTEIFVQEDTYQKKIASRSALYNDFVICRKISSVAPLGIYNHVYNVLAT